MARRYDNFNTPLFVGMGLTLFAVWAVSMLIASQMPSIANAIGETDPNPNPNMPDTSKWTDQDWKDYHDRQLQVIQNADHPERLRGK